MTKGRSNPGVALITGAAQRIGAAIAEDLAAGGFTIALHYHNSKDLAEQTAQRIRNKGGRCRLFSCDLVEEKQILRMVAEIKRLEPRWNLLINNASLFLPSKFLVEDLDLLDRHYQVNVRAPFLLSCAFAKVCQQGNIINILDTHIVKDQISQVAYLLSKKNLAEMTRMAAVAFAPRIRVNGICPGLILPPAGKGDGYLKKLASRVPLKKEGSLSNITRCVRFILENVDLTGQFIFNDGGEHLTA